MGRLPCVHGVHRGMPRREPAHRAHFFCLTDVFDHLRYLCTTFARGDGAADPFRRRVNQYLQDCAKAEIEVRSQVRCSVASPQSSSEGSPGLGQIRPVIQFASGELKAPDQSKMVRCRPIFGPGVRLAREGGRLAVMCAWCACRHTQSGHLHTVHTVAV
jgi:hypothetical protein